MKLRNTLTATALAASLLTLGACSRVAGSAVGIPPAGSTASAVTVTVTSTAVTPPPASPEPTSSDPSSSDLGSAHSTSPDPTIAPDRAEPTDLSTTTETATDPDPSRPAQGDTVTTAWVSSICTGMGTVLGQLVDDKPHLAADASVGTLRQAMVDYYAVSTKTIDAAFSDAKAVRPPNVADGAAIHQAYQDFLSGLVDIFYNAALEMSDTTDVAAIEKVNGTVDQRITALGSNNAALQAMSAGPLADIAKDVPACRKVAELSAGS